MRVWNTQSSKREVNDLKLSLAWRCGACFVTSSSLSHTHTHTCVCVVLCCVITLVRFFYYCVPALFIILFLYFTLFFSSLFSYQTFTLRFTEYIFFFTAIKSFSSRVSFNSISMAIRGVDFKWLVLYLSLSLSLWFIPILIQCNFLLPGTMDFSCPCLPPACILFQFTFSTYFFSPNCSIISHFWLQYRMLVFLTLIL